MYETIEPVELKRRLEAGEELVLVDVREPEELAICRLPGVVHIPLGELVSRREELDPDHSIVLVCHHGIRSGHAAGYLSQFEFRALFNLAGGVDRWSAEVDPSMPRY